MNGKIIRLFKDIKNRPKTEKPTSQIEVRKAGKQRASAAFLFIVITHIVVSIVGINTLLSFNINVFASVIIVIVFELIMYYLQVDSCKQSIAKKQKKGLESDIINLGEKIPILPNSNFSIVIPLLFLVAYWGSLMYKSFTSTIESASKKTETLTTSEQLELNDISYEFESDSTRISNEYESKKRYFESKIQSAIAEKLRPYNAQKAEIQKAISWCKANGFDYSQRQKEVNEIEKKIKSIPTPQYLSDSLTKCESTFITLMGDAKSKYISKRQTFMKDKKISAKNSISYEKIKVVLYDLLLIFVILLQHLAYSTLIQYLVICSLSLKKFLSLRSEDVNIQKGERLTSDEAIKILKDLKLSESQIRGWKRRQGFNNDSKLKVFESYMEQNGVLVEWSNDYPKFYKIKKSA